MSEGRLHEKEIPTFLSWHQSWDMRGDPYNPEMDESERVESSKGLLLHDTMQGMPQPC